MPTNTAGLFLRARSRLKGRFRENSLAHIDIRGLPCVTDAAYVEPAHPTRPPYSTTRILCRFLDLKQQLQNTRAPARRATAPQLQLVNVFHWLGRGGPLMAQLPVRGGKLEMAHRPLP